MTEEWRPVTGYENAYEISDGGRVRSMRSGHIKSARVGKNGYQVVCLGHADKRYVHALVLEAFIGPRPDGQCACHRNGNKLDNRISNLRWDTYSANNFDIVEHGRSWQRNKTRCKNGHEFTAENTYYRREGGRKCITCQRAAERRSHDKLRKNAAA